jgi:hypothetical protein
MRIRTIKPGFWKNEELSSVSSDACLLAIGLLNYADDEGYFNANPALIKADIFPLREISGSIPTLLRELSNINYIELFSTSDNKNFGFVKTFSEHQYINRPTPSKIKGLELLPHNSVSAPGAVSAGKEGKGKESICAFSEFYAAYPKKISKGAAEKSYLAALKKTTHEAIMLGLARYNQDITENKTPRQFIKLPATWLNQGCWDDVYQSKKEVLPWGLN